MGCGNISILVFMFGLVLGVKLPINFQTCKIDDSSFDSCLATAIQEALPKLKDGINSPNVSPIEPMKVPSMTIGEGQGAVHVVQHFENIRIFGASDTNVTKVDGSKIRDFRLYAETFTPRLRIEAHYRLNGRILLIPIQGDGNCTITLENLHATHTTIGEKLEKKGKIYMRAKQYIITLNPEKVQFYFGNLFNGDERLGKEMNNVLNENWKEVFDDVKSGYEESFGIIFGDVSNKIYTKVPFKDIFLD